MKIAIYPGSFDPITLGHLDIIRRAALCFDKVFVCVMDNCDKKSHMFPAEKRLEMLRRSVEELPNVEAELYRGLLADYAREKGDTSLSRVCAMPRISIWSIRWPPSTGAFGQSWRRCSCRPALNISTSAPPWCGR